MEEIDGTGEIEGRVFELYLAERQAQEFCALVIRETYIRLEFFVAEKGGIAGPREIEHQASLALDADLSVVVAEGGLDPRDVRFQPLPALRVEVGDAHVLQNELFDIEVQGLGGGGSRGGGAIGGDLDSFHDVEFSRAVLNEIEMAILQQDHFYMVLLFEDVGEAEADEHAFGLVDRLYTSDLAGEQLY